MIKSLAHPVVLFPQPQSSRHAKVADLDKVLVDQENIPRCQIPVHKLPALQVLHGTGHLQHQDQDFGHLDLPGRQNIVESLEHYFCFYLRYGISLVSTMFILGPEGKSE